MPLPVTSNGHAGARHPLLLARCLPVLPKLVEGDDAAFENSFLGKAVALTPAPAPVLEDSESDEEYPPTTRELPQPVDLTVPPQKTSVVLTGPNTGESSAI